MKGIPLLCCTALYVCIGEHIEQYTRCHSLAISIQYSSLFHLQYFIVIEFIWFASHVYHRVPGYYHKFVALSSIFLFYNLYQIYVETGDDVTDERELLFHVFDLVDYCCTQNKVDNSYQEEYGVAEMIGHTL